MGTLTRSTKSHTPAAERGGCASEPGYLVLTNDTRQRVSLRQTTENEYVTVWQFHFGSMSAKGRPVWPRYLPEKQTHGRA